MEMYGNQPGEFVFRYWGLKLMALSIKLQI